MLRRAEIVNANHLNTKTVTGNYTATDKDDVILVDATAAAVTVTLPDAVAQKNLSLVIKKVDSGGNAVTVATSLAQTIDGGATVSLSSQYATLSVVADGANWQIRTVNASSTFTGGTISGATTVNNTLTIASASATSFTVGPNGATNPVLQIDGSVASAATGILITGRAAAGAVTIAVISSGTNETLKIDAKGSGQINLGSISTGTIICSRDLQFSAHNIITDTTTGTKIGTATTQKLGFFNATPIVQPAASADITGFAAGVGTASKSDSTWTGSSGSSAYTVGGLVTQLKALGLIAA